jgi:hypothetical protein
MIPLDIELKAFVTSKLKNHLVKVKVKNALDTMDYNFTSTVGYNSKLVGGKIVLQRHHKIEGIKCDL